MEAKTQTKCVHCDKLISTRNMSIHHKHCRIKREKEIDDSKDALIAKINSLEANQSALESALEEKTNSLACKDAQITTLEKVIDNLLKHTIRHDVSYDQLYTLTQSQVVK